MESRPQTVLVLDEDPIVLERVRSRLESHGIPCLTSGDPHSAVEAAAWRTADVLLIDLHLATTAGAGLLESVRRADHDLPVILMVDEASVDAAGRALVATAYDSVAKPLRPDQVLASAQRALERRRLTHENAALRETLLLYQLSQAVAASVGETEVLDLVVKSAARELGTDRVSLFVREVPGSPLVRWRNGHDGSSVLAEAEERLARLAADRDEPVLAPDDTGGGLPEGVSGALSVPLHTHDAVLGAITALGGESMGPFTRANLQTLEIIGQSAAAVMRNARYARHVIEPSAGLVEANLGTIGALISALDAREHETQVHSIRVAEYALRLAKEIDMSPAERVDLKFGAMLHDIGKIGIGDAILLKPGTLTDEEWDQMRRHPMIGYQILRDIASLEGAAKIVLYHQERYDGTGYPFGLSGEGIPIGARLFAIVDTFDAMTSDRPYRAALVYDDVVRELVRHRGAQFDPRLVDAFLAVPSGDWDRIRDAAGGSRLVWQPLPHQVAFPVPRVQSGATFPPGIRGVPAIH